MSMEYSALKNEGHESSACAFTEAASADLADYKPRIVIPDCAVLLELDLDLLHSGQASQKPDYLVAKADITCGPGLFFLCFRQSSGA
jgi:hypothetical protein